MNMRSTLARQVLVTLLALAAFGCSTTKTVAPPPDDPRPARSSAAGVVHRMEWDWQNLDAADYTSLLAGDFRFVPAMGDSAGAGWSVSSPWNREVERLCITRMFDAAPESPPIVRSMTLNLDRTLVSLPDPRPGKNSKWHRTIRTHIDLKMEVDLGGGSLDAQIVVGDCQFFLVRGDSAALTPEQLLEGATQDSTQWWIERWEDETLSYGGLSHSPTPARHLTIAQLKSRFLPSRFAAR